MDDVWINISSQHVIDFTDSEHYYIFDTGFDEAGYYYIVLEYTFTKSRPAPNAKALIVKPSQVGAYTPGNSWLFLKAVKVEGVGPFYITDVEDYDPMNPDNKRTFLRSYAGSEVALPTHLPEKDQGRFVYGLDDDDFFFGLSDRWVALSAVAGSSFEANVTGFDIGELVFINNTGNLQLALASLPNTTADGVVTKIGTNGIIRSSGLATNVKIESGGNVNVGDIVYLSKNEPGKISSQKSTPYSQFVGRCVAADTTSASILFHRGEPTAAGDGSLNLGTSIPLAFLPAGGWIGSGGSFYQDIDISDIFAKNAVITVWDATSGLVIQPENLEFVSDDLLRVWIPVGDVTVEVFIIGQTDSTIPGATIGKVTDTLSAGAAWLSSGSLYYQTIDVSSLIGRSSAVMVRDTSTNKMIMPAEIDFDSTSTLKIWMPTNTLELEVVVIGPSSTPQTTTSFSTIIPSGASWTLSGGQYYQDVDISIFNDDNLVLQFYDYDSNEVTIPTVEFITGFIRVWMPDNTHQLNVTIIG
ncbi:MAG: hypothetical protein K9L62_10725 [Vallitaleaceae bacterium]|nr:hypothetical protein [Vallitaleaceae bacterium]